MEIFKPVLLENIKIYRTGLDKGEFSFCNIMSNRLITESVILDSKIYVLIGAIFKENLKYLNVTEERVEDIKKILLDFVDKINKNEDLRIEYVIENYYKFYYDIRELLSFDHEKYEENKDYSIYSTKFCIKFLLEEMETQNIPYNEDLLFFGISNELGRIYRNYGCTSHQLLLYIIMSFSGRLYDYYRFIILSDDSKKNFWEKKFFKIKEKIKENLHLFDITDEYLNNSMDLLFVICKEWRYMFLRLLDLPTTTTKVKTTITPKVKDELKGMVSKMVNKELKGD